MNAFDLNYIGVDELVEDELIDVNGGQIITLALLAFLGTTLTIGGIAVPLSVLMLAGIAGAAGVAGIGAAGGMAGMLIY